MITDLVLRYLVVPYLLLCEHYGITAGILVMTLPITIPLSILAFWVVRRYR